MLGGILRENDDYGRRTNASSTADTVTYTWDTVGQLASVTSAESTSTYAYGPTGMREKVTVTSPGSSRITESVWEGGRLALERDSDGTTYRYVYGPDSLPLELIVTAQGGQPVSYAYLCDRGGSVVALTDSNGAVVATYAYDPWGTVLAATDVNGSGLGARNPLRYRGYYYDVATALYYLPARYYDPVVAWFLSPDPAAPSAGDPLSLNRYAYCVGDPVNHDDPTGAIMDVDGNGRIDSWDSAYAAAKHTSDWMRAAVFRNRARRNFERSQDRDARKGLSLAHVPTVVLGASELGIAEKSVWGLRGITLWASGKMLSGLGAKVTYDSGKVFVKGLAEGNALEASGGAVGSGAGLLVSAIGLGVSATESEMCGIAIGVEPHPLFAERVLGDMREGDWGSVAGEYYMAYLNWLPASQ